VKVFNIVTKDTIDGYLTDLLYYRIEQIVRDTSIVNDDFKPGLESEILGELCEIVKVSDILESAKSLDKIKTEKEMEEALKRAKKQLENNVIFWFMQVLFLQKILLKVYH